MGMSAVAFGDCAPILHNVESTAAALAGLTINGIFAIHRNRLDNDTRHTPDQGSTPAAAENDYRSTTG